jgi:SAM-dependent methyltransferase
MSLQNVLFPERFKNPSRFYTTGRPSYPKLLARRVTDLIALTRNDDVLDLGTGPGFLAIDYAPYAHAVTAVDPSEEMLSAARQNAARAEVSVRFVRGSSFELTPELGRFKLVTIGRAFHWMDRAQTLDSLEALIVARGAVALFGERHPDVPDNAWYPQFQALIDSYSTEDPAKSRTRGQTPHEGVLLESAFSHLERVSVLEVRHTPVEHLVDRALSFGSTWEGRPGSREQDLAGEVRALVAQFVHGGVVREVIEGHALVGLRPREL